ncbi:hypothetical protein KFK09_014175 [Dendrobium nobile]|uniref:Uncharacterized protein n=1 Tax=Dendrobium nobile TaxID=94219 RepID=A0A8T3BBA9_DENNO|nr:hypothetical protein KFK09_014175 [Dendrobium nobile]
MQSLNQRSDPYRSPIGSSTTLCRNETHSSLVASSCQSRSHDALSAGSEVATSRPTLYWIKSDEGNQDFLIAKVVLYFLLHEYLWLDFVNNSKRTRVLLL